jgi:hypothetical protein
MIRFFKFAVCDEKLVGPLMEKAVGVFQRCGCRIEK